MFSYLVWPDFLNEQSYDTYVLNPILKEDKEAHYPKTDAEIIKNPLRVENFPVSETQMWRSLVARL